MKKIYLISSLIFIVVLGANAQNSRAIVPGAGSIKSDAKKAAGELCECINTLMEDMHPSLVEMVLDMKEIGPNAAEEKFTKHMMSLSEEEQQEILEDVQRMENFDAEMERIGCNSFDEKYAKYEGNTEFEQALFENLEKLEKCELAYAFLIISGEGASEED